ncbi:MAG: TetR/AcrR family transcriptional regulator [Deltaproteobacteria bacterium]|jgi:AcrR family transcriptional regulator|nr:TetR/AcrR family transcriptional regulator [Deltaproteobacteria bacterium]MBT4639291.1 TetR/AcrR family transcriptional regulator [Deltaproteobacteria bacterium]
MAEQIKPRISAAALTVFMRHGYKKATMNDIAIEAGISRPAIYLVFKNKQDIFKAVVVEFFNQATSEIRNGLAKLKTVEEKLRFAFEVWYIRPAISAKEEPYSLELTETFNKYAEEQHQEGLSQFEQILESIIAPYSKVLAKNGLNPQGLAHMLSLSGNGFKQEYKSLSELKEQINILTTLILFALKKA